MIEFFVSCVPPTTSHHHKRIVKIGKFSRLADKPELVEAKQLLESLLLPFQPPVPIGGAVTLGLEFTWPWLKGHSKRVRACGRIPHTSRPDCSNLTKTLEDRLVALRFMGDDNAVVELHVQKWWGDTPGIRIRLKPFVAPTMTAEQYAAEIFDHRAVARPPQERLIYEQTVGPIAPGLVIRHKCDNPSCVRPDHLETGTTADNQRDKVLTAAQVIEIRLSYQPGRAGFGGVSLAKKFGVSPATINHIINNRTWKHLPPRVAGTDRRRPVLPSRM